MLNTHKTETKLYIYFFKESSNQVREARGFPRKELEAQSGSLQWKLGDL